MTTPSGASASPPPFAPRGVQETLVIPLYAKALDYRSKHSILHDAKADEIVRSTDYDFEHLRSAGTASLFAARARQLDDWVREFLAANPDGVVLNLGCGLDSRISRIAPPTTVWWADVDFPEVIELRRRYFADGAGYRMLAAALTPPTWLERVPRDRPGIVIADGVFEYLAEDEVRTVLTAVIGHLPRGQLGFDLLSSRSVALGNARLRAKTGAVLKWGVDDLRTVDRLATGMRRTATQSLLFSKFLSLRFRLLASPLRLFPRARRAMRLVRYDF